MKYIIYILTLAVMLCIPNDIHSQIRSTTIDHGFSELSGNAFPDTRYYIDDALQYVPAAAMIITKAVGYESRSSWGKMLTADAFSTLIMAGTVNSLKYSVKRMRPDGSEANSFPSGHAATSFMTATMLHKEYGWRSPWFSFAGYTVASLTGLSRIINNKHWMTDVVAGALIGIYSVELGYFLADLIYRDKYTNPKYMKQIQFGLDPFKRYYKIGLNMGYRFILGDKDFLVAGSNYGSTSSVTLTLDTDIPIKRNGGITIRTGVNSMLADQSNSFNSYNIMVGGYWSIIFSRIMEASARGLAGCSLVNSNKGTTAAKNIRSGLDLAAGLSLAVKTGPYFKLKAFAEYEAFHYAGLSPLVNTMTVGGSIVFFW